MFEGLVLIIVMLNVTKFLEQDVLFFKKLLMFLLTILIVSIMFHHIWFKNWD